MALLTAFHGSSGGGILMEELIAEGAQQTAEVLVCALGFISSFISATAEMKGVSEQEILASLGLYVATEQWTTE
jgi:hypothetical protein